MQIKTHKMQEQLNSLHMFLWKVVYYYCLKSSTKWLGRNNKGWQGFPNMCWQGSPSLDQPKIYVITYQKLCFWLYLYHFYFNFIFFVHTGHAYFNFNQRVIFTECCFWPLKRFKWSKWLLRFSLSYKLQNFPSPSSEGESPHPYLVNPGQRHTGTCIESWF